MSWTKRTERLLAKAHRWKNSHQYLGRYSVEKLYVFDEYQRCTGAWRVFAVLTVSPVPVLAVILTMEAIPLGDPAAGLSRNGVTTFRSVASHTVLVFAMLLTVKKAIRLPDDGYSAIQILLVAGLVGVSLEFFWLPFMILWRYPVPFREFLGLVPFGALVVVANWLIARDVFITRCDQLKKILPILGAQLSLFYMFLGFSIGFAYVPLAAQVGMILVFPVVKVFLKKTLWQLAHRLDDLTTDVTICMIEISGSLYQTVCLQHVQSQILGVLILVMDFLQAVVEVRLYMAHDYVADHRSTLHTAVKIVETALFPSVKCVDKPLAEATAPVEPNLSVSRWCLNKGTAKVHSIRDDKLVGEPIEDVGSHSLAVRRSFVAAAHSVQLAPQSVFFNTTSRQLLDLSSLGVSIPMPSTPGGVETQKPMLLPGSIQVDGIKIARRDQARVLEQSLQLLFSCEVLLFVEFMEVLMPLIYGVYVGVAWHLPNAKYNYVLRAMTREQMVQGVGSSLVYAALESVSLAVMCWLMNKKYGVQPLYQLAFVLESYWMTLHGKLIGAFITIVNSATVHQGIDFTFKFQYGAS